MRGQVTKALMACLLLLLLLLTGCATMAGRVVILQRYLEASEESQ